MQCNIDLNLCIVQINFYFVNNINTSSKDIYIISMWNIYRNFSIIYIETINDWELNSFWYLFFFINI